MIVFKVVRWRNFLSTGNQWNEIQINTAKTSLIVGKNGEGKSTFLDAFTFGLFGKPFRNINKPQLVNSINQKGLSVEIEFNIGQKEYKVIRGIKPNIFEIWCDGVLINQDSDTTDYQQVLEDQILKLTYKSCTQIVILGSASFTPFMNLPAGAKRDVIEDLLDIKIFSLMRKVLKDRSSTANVQIINLENEISVSKEKFAVNQKYLKNLEQDKEARIAELDEMVHNSMVQLQEVVGPRAARLNTQKESLLVELKDKTKLDELSRSIAMQLSKAQDKIKGTDKAIKFYEINDQCPTCAQEITHEHKNTLTARYIKTKEDVQTELDALIVSQQELIDNLTKTATKADLLAETDREITMVNSEIQALQNSLDRLNKDIISIKSNVGNIEAESTKIKELAGEIADKLKARNGYQEELTYLDLAELLLKDNGIKTQIIKQYLPTINKLVNKYLQSMDLFIQFELDEGFNEVIKSRNRDQFSYASFSEGEKHRINLALLFAWRAVASLRNTTNTNLLIFDEVLDGSLDDVGVDCFLQMIKEIGDHISIFVITHKQDLFIDKFDRVIVAKKTYDYSELEVLEK